MKKTNKIENDNKKSRKLNNEPHAFSLTIKGNHNRVDVSSISNTITHNAGNHFSRYQQKSLVSYLPHRPTPCFIGRTKELAGLENLYNTAKTPILVAGMRGIGKTETSLMFAHNMLEKNVLVGWVDASTKETIIEDLSKLLYMNLGYTRPKSSWESEDMAYNALRMLENYNIHNTEASQKQWLLIYDNVTHESYKKYIESWQPKFGPGNIVMTTYAPEAFSGYFLSENQIKLEPLRLEVSLEFLAKRTGKKFQKNTAEFLAAQCLLSEERLNGLPLAIDQAAAYIVYNQIPITKYLSLYENYNNAILESDYSISPNTKSVYVSFSIAYDNISKKNKPARELVRRLALLAPAKFPRIFVDSDLQINDSCQVLRDAGLFLNMDEEAILSHSLTLEVMHNIVKKEDDYINLALDTLTWIEEVFPEHNIIAVEPRAKDLSPHAQHLFINIKNLISAFSLDKKDIVAKFADKIACYLILECGRYSEAIDILKQTMCHIEDNVSIENRLLIQEHIACAHRYREEEGDYEKAIEMHKHNYREYLAAFSVTDTRTLSSMHNLGIALYYLGTRESLKKAVNIFEKEIDHRQSDQSAFRGLIAGMVMEGLCLQKIGTMRSINKAEKILKGAYNIALKHVELGEKNTLTLWVANALAMALKLKGSTENLIEAKNIHVKNLRLRREISGNNHPETLSTIHNLSNNLKELGRTSSAIRLGRYAFEKRRRLLGNTHLNTVLSMEDLALCLQERGSVADFPEIENLFVGSSKIRKQSREFHPDTLRNSFYLASFLIDIKKNTREGIAMLHDIYKKQRELLGVNNIDAKKTKLKLITAENAL